MLVDRKSLINVLFWNELDQIQSYHPWTTTPGPQDFTRNGQVRYTLAVKLSEEPRVFQGYMKKMNVVIYIFQLCVKFLLVQEKLV